MLGGNCAQPPAFGEGSTCYGVVSGAVSPWQMKGPQ
jgi:hypothetical protein